MTSGSPTRRLVAVTVAGSLAWIAACGTDDNRLRASGDTDATTTTDGTSSTTEVTTTTVEETPTTVLEPSTTTEAPQPLVVHRWINGKTVTQPPEGLVITMSAPERTTFGADEFITVTITVSNTSDETIVLRSPSGKTVDAGLVRDGDWVGGYDYGYTAVLTEVEYSPGESQVHEVRVAAWRGEERLPPGQYILAGGYDAQDFLLASPLIRVTVTA